ncbi:TerC family protein [Peribacillus kribbensis]|uniref:TerC family protein n=1 Tax=Peribacillus kribbensis TaxID=356658 RepID=UPI00040C5231|nr:TerC family protein [Peribacillus kribbensis]
MDFLHDLLHSYGSFFSWDALKAVISDPGSWAVVGTLVILEGLLSADNALVLAVMVKHLPKKQQKKALFYGIIGAYLFRFLAIGLGVFLIKITWIKIAGGLYLLYLSLSYFIKKNKDDGEEEVKNKNMGFWRTVLTVEIMDIAFSIDSVIAAFGVSDSIWVLFLGGILGVLMMRGVAQLFLALIERVPEFETTAFVMIALIAVKMIVSPWFHLEELIFFGILIVVFLGTFVVHKIKKNRTDAHQTGTNK